MSLRHIIESFLNHVQLFDARYQEGEDLYDKEFVSLKTLTDELKKNSDFSSSHGESEINRPKNRYKDILPYNYTRVPLCEIDGIPGSDYINASYIKGASGTQAYIASQGPLQQTLEDFWRMAWECKIQVIVMASNEVECGKHKCERYWAAESEEKQIGSYTVKLVTEREVCSDFLVRTLNVRCADEERAIVQFHYRSWPDHGVPTSVTPILELVRLIRDCQSSEALPVLIHCSAGCGRTGTICAIDYVWGLLRAGKLNENFNLLQLVLNMRKQRTAMVQTKEQYMLVYKAIQELFERHLRVIDSHLYENVDFSGKPIEVNDEDDYISLGAVEDMIDAVDNEEVPKSDCSQTPPLPEKKKKKNEDVIMGSTESVNNSIDVEQVVEDKPKLEELVICKPEERDHVLEPVRLRSGATLAVGSDSFLDQSSRSPSPYDKKIRKSSPDLSLSESRGSKVSRRPSIARLRAFFEKRVSGPIYDSDDALGDGSVKLRKTPDTTSSSVSPDLDYVEDVGNRRHGQVMNLLEEKEYNEVVNRYRDTALVVFNELQLMRKQEQERVRCSAEDDRKSVIGSEKLDETLPSCSSDDQVHSDNGSVRSIYDNANGAQSSGNNSSNSTPGPVRSRNSESPGKRSTSTWYDTELEDTSSPVPRENDQMCDPSKLQVNEAKQGVFGSLFKNGKSGSSITRSISMKVGIQSPFAKRRAAKEKCNVAAYLAVEEGDENNKDQKAGGQFRSLKNNFSFKKTTTEPPVTSSTPLNSSDNSVGGGGRGESFKTYVNLEESVHADSRNQSSSPKLLRYTKNIEDVASSSPASTKRQFQIPDIEFNVEDDDILGGKCSRSFVDEVRGSIENLFGEDMDEYCQQIIRSCQDYLVAAEYTNVTPKSMKNIEWIENTLRENPRRAIVDVTSTSSQIEIFDNDYANYDVVGNQKEDNKTKKRSNHDYEKLWFAESCNLNTELPRGKKRNDDFKLTLNVKFDVNDAKKKESHIGKVKDTQLNKTVQDLQSLIEELEMNIPKCQSQSAGKSKPKKPQPAPRTILKADKTGDISSDDFVPVQHREGKPSEVHIYERIFPLDPDYNVVTRTGVVDFDDEDVSRIYGQIQKAKGPNCSLADSCEGSEMKPQAPPRLKRQPSSSSRQSVPIATSSGYVTTISTGQASECTGFEDEIPPVPIKTKDAYLLPSDKDGNGVEGHERLKSEGLSIGKAFGKLHVVNLLSKFGLKGDTKEYESPSASPDNQSPLLSRRVLPAATSDLGYPHRFQKRPVGPRECPAN